MNKIFKDLVGNSLHLMTDYTDDLMKHDKKTLEDNPGVPFLHFTRATGTGLIMLSTKNWPRKGETIPYLFGSADRNHLLKELENTAQHYRGNSRLIQHYDGNMLHIISHDEAMFIVDALQYEIMKGWREEK